MSLTITPIAGRTKANCGIFVAAHHRHHKPVIGHKFSIAVSENGIVRGVAMVGRPVSRRLDDGWTLEVSRCCTDGASNACSMLYGAAWRAAKALGYRRMIDHARCPMKVAPVCAHRAGVLSGFVAAVMERGEPDHYWRRYRYRNGSPMGKNHYGCRA